MPQQFIATISATLSFSQEEVEYLALSAEHHYEPAIRALVPPGPGALINGMRAQFIISTAAEARPDYTFREIDMLHKAIEFDQDIIAMRLQRRFRIALKNLTVISQAINSVLLAVSEAVQ